MAFFIPLLMAAASAYSASQQGSRADKLERRQEGLEEEDLALRRRLFAESEARYKPILDSLYAEYQAGPSFQFKERKAELERGYQQAERKVEQGFRQTGMAGTGLEASQKQALALGKATDLARAWQEGRERRSQVAMQLLDRSGFQQSTQNLLGGLREQAASAGQRSDQYAQAAAQGYGQAASALGEMGFDAKEPEGGLKSYTPGKKTPRYYQPPGVKPKY